jgi:hypothetical protein
VRCAKCAASLADDSWICSRCGNAVQPRHHIVRLEFTGGPVEALLWAIIATLVSVSIAIPPMVNVRLVSVNFPGPWMEGSVSFPLLVSWLAAAVIALAGAWVFEAACRWFCRSLSFSDDSTAGFSGRAGQILGWWAVWMVAGRRWHGVRLYSGVLEVGIWLAGMYATVQVLRWFVKHVELSSGTRFRFTARFGEFVGWEVLLGLSVLTIIGWAWVLAAMYRWMARHTESETRALHFHGEAPQLLWRTVATLLFCIPVITIPWAWLWYARWLVRNTTIEGQLGDSAY